MAFSGPRRDNPAATRAMAACHNCRRFTPVPFKHSFSTALEQTKNQSFAPQNSSWMVTPTASLTPALTGTVFCSGDCLFSFLFSKELLSSRNPDQALHFFKRTDEQRQFLASQSLLMHPGSDCQSLPGSVSEPSRSRAE